MVRLSRCCSGTTSACASCICSTGQRWRSDRMRFGSPELQNCKHHQTAKSLKPQFQRAANLIRDDPRMTWDCLEIVAYFAHLQNTRCRAPAVSCLWKTHFVWGFLQKWKLNLRKQSFCARLPSKKKVEDLKPSENCKILPGSTLLLFSSLLLSTLLLPRLLFSSLAYSTQVDSTHLYCALLLYTLLYSSLLCSS